MKKKSLDISETNVKNGQDMEQRTSSKKSLALQLGHTPKNLAAPELAEAFQKGQESNCGAFSSDASQRLVGTDEDLTGKRIPPSTPDTK